MPPLDAAGRRIERDGADHRRHVHRAVVDNRSRLKVVALADLEHAHRREARGGGRVDLLERREARAAVVVGVEQPVRRPKGRIQRGLIGSGGGGRRSGCARNERWRSRARSRAHAWLGPKVFALQPFRGGRQRRRARRKPVRLEDVRKHRGVILRSQRAGRSRRHRRPRDEEDVGERHERMGPARLERGPGERRRDAAGERRAVAPGARLPVHRFAARGLCVSEERGARRRALSAGRLAGGDENCVQMTTGIARAIAIRLTRVEGVWIMPGSILQPDRTVPVLKRSTVAPTSRGPFVAQAFRPANGRQASDDLCC